MSLFGYRERREIAELNAYVDRLRAQRDKALEDAATWKGVSERASEMFTDTNIVNECLTRDLTEERQVSGSLARQIQAMAEQLRAYQSVDGTDWQPKYESEKRRADRLQQRLDDAFGLNTPAVATGATWRDRADQKMRYDA